MQFQPPDKNNPANPLHKVAALTLDKEFEGDATRVAATLTFKKSNDLRGRGRTKDGRDVAVNFGLALERASFELTFSTDASNSPDGLVRIRRWRSSDS